MKKHKLLFLLTVLPALCACASLNSREKLETIKPLPPDSTWDVQTKNSSAPPANPITPDTPDGTWIVPIQNSDAPASR